jgi:nucleotide-binding universal stress UspA family protein
VVPLDGSSVAETIIPFIVDIAGPLDMEVILLRVVEPIAPVVIEGSRHVEVEDVEARRTDAEEYLAPIAVELRNKAVRVQSRVRRGNPANEIVAAARETGADLIAMSTHGRGGVRLRRPGRASPRRDARAPDAGHGSSGGEARHPGADGGGRRTTSASRRSTRSSPSSTDSRDTRRSSSWPPPTDPTCSIRLCSGTVASIVT